MVSELVEQFGAEFMVNMKEWQPQKPGRARIEQLKVNEKLAQVDGHLANSPTRHAYEFPEYGTDTVLTVVWDRYYPSKHQARGIMSRALASAGVTRDRVAHVWVVPEERRSPPLPEDIAKYRLLTEYAIHAANSQHVLLVGAGAMQMWRKDLRVSEIHGQPFAWKGRWIVFPVYNPMALVIDANHVDAWRRDLHALCMSIQGEKVNWMSGCYACDEDADVWDENAVGWCREHFKFTAVTNIENDWNKKAKQHEPKLL